MLKTYLHVRYLWSNIYLVIYFDNAMDFLFCRGKISLNIYIYLFK